MKLDRRLNYLLCTMAAVAGLGITPVATAVNVPDAPTGEWEVRYNATVRNIPDSARSVKIWVPVPSDGNGQSISDLRVVAPVPYRRIVDAEYGNVALLFEAEQNLPDSVPLTISFHARRAESGAIPPVTTARTPMLKRYLAPDSLIPIDGQIAELALSVVTGQTTDRAKARAIYDYILGTMSYDKSGSGWGQGDAVFACTERRGNCTDIHSLLIGMARATGIPARFVMGIPVPPNQDEGTIEGYHCWADLYLDGLGWVPIDASEAIKHREKAEFYFGKLDPNRVAFTIGRDISLTEGEETTTVNYFIYPVVRIDGHDHSDVSREITFHTLPAQSLPAH